jgi:hypothetical protein
VENAQLVVESFVLNSRIIFSMNYSAKIIEDIELHSVDGIRECFLNGVNPNDTFNNEPLINELTSEYTRTPRFKDCVKTFVEHGLTFEDKTLLAVLLDDHKALIKNLNQDSQLIHKRYSLRCAYTPLFEVTLLHICAEFNHVACAEVLVNAGADFNAKAGMDENEFGGQTPIFHTVNQNSNNSIDMMHFLLSKTVDLTYTVKGLVWGKGYPWETFVPAVNPISYAMMGLIPQMHRKEKNIATVISTLVKAAYGIEYVPVNIPNQYLALNHQPT